MYGDGLDNYVPEPNTGCWLWLGALDHGGYPLVKWHGKERRACRVVYEQQRGPIPEGLTLDHFACAITSCVNPWHQEPVTRGENSRRGRLGQGHHNTLKTHCPRGHPYSDENTLRLPTGKGRRCRICRTKQESERHRTKRGKETV